MVKHRLRAVCDNVQTGRGKRQMMGAVTGTRHVAR